MNSRVLSSILKHLKSMPTFDQVGIEQYRTLLEVSAKAFKPDENTTFNPLKINNIDAEKIIPEDASSKKTILFIHGGGYVAGSINSHRDLASRLGKEAKAEVLLINYRLAPEHPYPAGLNDAFESYKYLLDQNLSPEQVSIAGDSAGGGLALALLAKIKETKTPMPGSAVFMSPWIDLENKNPSIKGQESVDPMLDKRMLDQTTKLYAGNQDITNPLVSPINSNLKDLCPILIHVGENEVLLDDSLILAKKAKEHGVDANIEVFEEMFHVFQYFARYLSISRLSLKKMGAFIQEK